MLKDHLQQLVRDFAARHHLHRETNYMADIDRVRRFISVNTIPLSSAPLSSAPVSFTYHPEPASGQPTPLPEIWLRDRLSLEHQRMGCAHELGHLILGHSFSYPLYKIAPFFHSKEEREAWQAAAILLIPEHAINNSPHVRWLERVCLVPAWLINEYPGVQRAFSLPMQTRPAMFR